MNLKRRVSFAKPSFKAHIFKPFKWYIKVNPIRINPIHTKPFKWYVKVNPIRINPIKIQSKNFLHKKQEYFNNYSYNHAKLKTNNKIFWREKTLQLQNKINPFLSKEGKKIKEKARRTAFDLNHIPYEKPKEPNTSEANG
jgi:hypothetical protein